MEGEQYLFARRNADRAERRLPNGGISPLGHHRPSKHRRRSTLVSCRIIQYLVRAEAGLIYLKTSVMSFSRRLRYQ
jgi:hypothetical protein